MRHFALAGIAALLGSVPAFAQAPRVVQFDPTRADVRLADGRWQLVCEGRTIKDLGPNESDARESLQLIRSSHLTQFGTLGTPRPVLEYWLSDGHAPRGLTSGLPRMPFDLPSLRVEAWQGQWCIRDARQVLFVFGPHEADARQALEVFRRYEFNQVLYVGRTLPVMMCFFSDSDQPPLPAPPPNSPGPNNLWGSHEQPNALIPPGMLTVRQMSGANPLPMAFLRGGDWQPIDWQQATLQHDGQGWKLLAGAQCLGDFGPREEDARLALGAVRHYRFTELVTVGAGPAAFRFFLTDGQAPHGMLPGLRAVLFCPDVLNVRQFPGGWTICQASQPLLDGGDTQDQANAALEAIQHFQFDTLCQVGEDGRGLRFPIRRW